MNNETYDNRRDWVYAFNHEDNFTFPGLAICSDEKVSNQQEFVFAGPAVATLASYEKSNQPSFKEAIVQIVLLHENIRSTALPECGIHEERA